MQAESFAEDQDSFVVVQSQVVALFGARNSCHLDWRYCLLEFVFGCSGSHKLVVDFGMAEAAVVEAGCIESQVEILGWRGSRLLGSQRGFEVVEIVQIVEAQFQFEDAWVLARRKMSSMMCETGVIVVGGMVGRNTIGLLFEGRDRRMIGAFLNTLSWSSHSVVFVEDQQKDCYHQAQKIVDRPEPLADGIVFVHIDQKRVHGV